MCTSFMKTNANIIYDSLKNKLNDEEVRGNIENQ